MGPSISIQITSTEVQSKEGGEHILDALVKETPLTLLSLIRDQVCETTAYVTKHTLINMHELTLHWR